MPEADLDAPGTLRSGAFPPDAFPGVDPDPGAPAAGAAALSRCPHCGAPVEGPHDEFCCHGCELAWTIIQGAGLGRYYDERETFAPRPEPMRHSWEAVPVAVDERGAAHASLMIDGLRCASCVWVTERVLERMPGVQEATVSYATGRATLSWDPERVDLPALAGRISALGYRPRLLGDSAALPRAAAPSAQRGAEEARRAGGPRLRL